MGRIHGRRGRVYIDVAGGGLASPLPFQSKWSVSFSTDKDDVTSFDDTNKTYVAGLPDASGDFSGFYDDATSQTYQAASDGIPRKFYLYPNLSNVTQYWYGIVLPDFKVDGDVASSVTVASSWVAAGPFNKSTL
jgi:hypothetical protein